MSDEVEITESCGCVFCDLGLEPNGELRGKPIHRHRHGYSYCLNEEAFEARKALSEYERDGGKTMDEVRKEIDL